MNEKEQRQLHRVMARHRCSRTVTKEGNINRFSEPTGQNWHLDTYTFTDGTQV
jgi:hypothetical protein